MPNEFGGAKKRAVLNAGLVECAFLWDRRLQSASTAKLCAGVGVGVETRQPCRLLCRMNSAVPEPNPGSLGAALPNEFGGPKKRAVLNAGLAECAFLWDRRLQSASTAKLCAGVGVGVETRQPCRLLCRMNSAVPEPNPGSLAGCFAE